jgi:hypothetical protein
MTTPGPSRGGHDPGPDDSAAPDRPDEPAAPEVLDAGFTHRHGGGAGFAAGGPLDGMLPGPELAWHAGAARPGRAG